MFLITTAYQKSRSKKQPDKPGKILFRIYQSSTDGKDRTVRTISSDIYGNEETVIKSARAEIVRSIKIIYLIILHRSSEANNISIDNVSDDFRLAINRDPSMENILKQSQTDFPLRADLVNVGKDFKRDFRFIHSEPEVDFKTILDFIFLLSQQAKNDGNQVKARSYSSTRLSLSKFLGGVDVPIKDIDKPFIIRYSSWLKGRGVADSTQSFYLRTLRSILNQAKENGLASFEDDLFMGLNTRIMFHNASHNRETVSRETINRISKLRFQDKPEAGLVRDMFMFAFYCRGMELTDVINLTHDNFQGDILMYKRRSVGQPHIVTLEKPAKIIIERYNKGENHFLFPIKDIYEGYQQFSITERVRRHIKEIGKAVGFPELTFSMNISAWKQMMSQINISELLLKTV